MFCGPEPGPRGGLLHPTLERRGLCSPPHPLTVMTNHLGLGTAVRLAGMFGRVVAVERNLEADPTGGVTAVFVVAQGWKKKFRGWVLPEWLEMT